MKYRLVDLANPNWRRQPRDGHGMWTDSGGRARAAVSKVAKTARAAADQAKADNDSKPAPPSTGRSGAERAARAQQKRRDAYAQEARRKAKQNQLSSGGDKVGGEHKAPNGSEARELQVLAKVKAFQKEHPRATGEDATRGLSSGELKDILDHYEAVAPRYRTATLTAAAAAARKRLGV
jgi:hypothetical protein